MRDSFLLLFLCISVGVAGWFLGTGSAPKPAPRGSGLNANQPHHSSIFVFQKMAVVKKVPDGIGIAKIHPHSYAGIYESLAVEIGNVHGVAKEGFFYRLAEIIEK
jgi:hypothetical protein